MALSGAFTGAATSSTITGLVGNVAFMLMKEAGTKGVKIRLEVSYDAGTQYSLVDDFTDSDLPCNKVMVSGDGTAIYRLKCSSVNGTVNYYIGQEPAA